MRIVTYVTCVSYVRVNFGKIVFFYVRVNLERFRWPRSVTPAAFSRVHAYYVIIPLIKNKDNWMPVNEIGTVLRIVNEWILMNVIVVLIVPERQTRVEYQQQT